MTSDPRLPSWILGVILLRVRKEKGKEKGRKKEKKEGKKRKWERKNKGMRSKDREAPCFQLKFLVLPLQ